MMKISAVLPVKVDTHKTNSLDQMQFLLTSVRKFFEPGFLDTFFIVTPGADIPFIRENYASFLQDLPIELIDEDELIPEMRSYKKVRGWRKQQLIKLAIAERVKTPYFITFDADVICIRPISADSIFKSGKAILHPLSKRSSQRWWDASAYTLGINIDYSTPGMNVTPAVLNTEMCLQLLNHIGAGHAWVSTLLKPHDRPKFLKVFRSFKRRYSWTEYTLYFLFLEKMGLVEHYHYVLKPEDNLLLISPNSLWNKTVFEDWDAERLISESEPGLFCVVQSNKMIPIDDLKGKLGTVLG